MGHDPPSPPCPCLIPACCGDSVRSLTVDVGPLPSDAVVPYTRRGEAASNFGQPLHYPPQHIPDLPGGKWRHASLGMSRVSSLDTRRKRPLIPYELCVPYLGLYRHPQVSKDKNNHWEVVPEKQIPCHHICAGLCTLRNNGTVLYL